METERAPSFYFDLADKHFGGGLADFLRECLSQGMSKEKIHYELWNRDIPVSTATIIRWCKYYI